MYLMNLGPYYWNLIIRSISYGSYDESLGLNAKCLTFLNAWKQMCSAGGSVPRNEFKLISPVLNSTKWESLKS